MALISIDDSGNLTDVLHCIFEKNQVHDGIKLVVGSETFVEPRRHGISVREHIVQFFIKTANKTGENQNLRVVFIEELLQIELGECLSTDVSGKLTVFSQVSVRNKSITIDALSLVNPQLDQFFRLIDGFRLCIEQTLEHICKVTHVELVVEILSCLTEVANDF